MEKEPVLGNRMDKIFAGLFFLLGYSWIFIFTDEYLHFERNIAWFTIAYAVIVLMYVHVKGEKPTKGSFFWFAVMLSLGIPYAFHSVMPGIQVLILIVTAAYWTMSVSGRMLDGGKTSNWILFDMWNVLMRVPFYNFTCQVRILFKQKEETVAGSKKHTIMGIFVGVILAIPMLLVILPLLSSADEGFSRLIQHSGSYITEHFMVTFIRILLTIPVAFYLFGLAYGSISGRGTERISKEQIWQTGRAMRIVPDTAVYTCIGIVCVVYGMFIWLQANYLFSAFQGIRPEMFTYAEYARRGFFELCFIAVLNMGILFLAGTFSKTEQRKNPGLRFLNVLVSALTLLLITTAMSKMGMYVNAYGLTVKRVLTLVFMLWMAIVFVAMIVRQWKIFAFVRLSVLTGAVMYALLCVFPVQSWIVNYNEMMHFAM